MALLRKNLRTILRTARLPFLAPWLPVVFAGGLLLGNLLLGSGCSQSKPEPIASPPDIPLLQAEESETATSQGILAGPMPFADIRALPEDDPYSIRLKLAVQAALDVDAVTAEGSASQFGPDQPITYQEFIQWTQAFKPLSPDEIENPPNPPTAEEEAPTEPLPSPENTSTPLTESFNQVLTSYKISLKPGSQLNREAFSLLYTVLTQQVPVAEALTEQDILVMTPKGVTQADASLGNTLSDATAITPPLQKFVALAYQHRILDKIFKIQPAINGHPKSAFHPKQPLTRGEAVLFLYHQYALNE